MPRFRPIAVLFAALALAACQEPVAPITDLDALLLSVSVSPGTVTAGTPADIRLVIANPTLRTIEFQACPIYYWVEDSKTGALVAGSRSIGCFAGSLVYMPILLRPFESKTFTWRWTETEGVPAGRYQAYGWIDWEPRVSRPVVVDVVAAAVSR